MSISLLFWLLMVLWLVAVAVPVPYGKWPGTVLLWVLLALIGWRVFGAMLHN
jgi:hypothetical protein